jgi:hypothetical protein
MEGSIRDEVLMRLVDQAMTDAEFRRDAQADPEATLARHGYDLTATELEAVKEFQREVSGLSDQELEQRIAGNGLRRQGS